MSALALTTRDGLTLTFALVASGEELNSAVDGLVEVSWGGLAGEEGYRDACVVELWLDDVAEAVRKDGSLDVCLGRWHTLDAGEAASLVSFLEGLLESRAPGVGPRSRPSALAA